VAPALDDEVGLARATALRHDDLRLDARDARAQHVAIDELAKEIAAAAPVQDVVELFAARNRATIRKKLADRLGAQREASDRLAGAGDREQQRRIDARDFGETLANLAQHVAFRQVHREYGQQRAALVRRQPHRHQKAYARRRIGIAVVHEEIAAALVAE